MKRLLTSLAVLLSSLLTTFAQYSGSGNGTEEDPYLIFNENQLSQMVNFLNQEGVVFKLMKNLDLTTWIEENNPRQGWIPVGVESSPFKGKFYGNNKRISGFYITRSSEDNVGFFGYIDSATIQDLTLEGTQVTGGNSVGALIGQSVGSTVSNVSVKMTDGVSGTDGVGGIAGRLCQTTLTDIQSKILGGVSGSGYIGGLAGYSLQNTSFTNFVSKANISGGYMVGGIIGMADNGTFQNGSETGDISANMGSAGGFAGKATTYQLTNMTTEGDITASGAFSCAGGMVAISDGTTSLTNCTFIGNIISVEKVGGIVGELVGGSSQTFTSCFSKGTLTNSGDYTGGVVAVSNGACIAGMESCSHFGDITGINYVGGLIGAILGAADVKPTLSIYTVYSGCFSSDIVRIPKPSGKLLQTTNENIINGTTVTSPINNCTAIGNINGRSWIGGLIGSDLSSYGYSPDAKTATCSNSSYNYKYLFKDSTYTGKSSYKSDLSYTHSYSRNSIYHSLTNNYYSGTIHGTNFVGGLVGLKGGGELKNNYAYANIYGDTNVGGIVGSTTAQTILSSYSVTTIKSNVANCPIISATSSDLGRIYGSIEGDEYTIIGALGSAEGNRALAQTKLILQGVVQEVEDDLQQGTSIGPSLLRLKATYVSMGWNFDENWNILETESYPYKKYQAAPPVIESNLVSQATSISGKSLDGGTVYLYYKDRQPVSTVCNGHQWTFETEPLQSGALVQTYTDVEGMTPSYFTTTNVGYPGSGTELDPWRIYTAEDLQGANKRGHYKVMNDIDLTAWIAENSPEKGWPAIGRNSGETTYIDGDGHKVTGLWVEAPDENFTGLFSNFSSGQIKNLSVEVAKGKKVIGGDYTGVLIGRNANGSILNCNVKGDVEGTNHVGGVAGYIESSQVKGIHYSGNVNSVADNAFVGGMAGMLKDCDVTNCSAKPSLSATGNNVMTGGLIGESTGGSVSNSEANGTLLSTGSDCMAGGLIGSSSSKVTQCAAGGTVSATGSGSYAGGLLGIARKSVDNSYSTATTTGYQFTAGLVAYTFSTIDKCYAQGDVYGVSYGGGIVGELDGPEAALTNSVACNNILSLSAQSSWGSRVIGGFKNGATDPDESNYALETMQVSLNDVPQNKTDDIVEGLAMSMAEILKKSFYESLGWDFSSVWGIDSGVALPYLLNVGITDFVVDDEPIATNTEAINVPTVNAIAGKAVEISICMDNESEDLTAFQFDMTLPDGVTLAKNQMGSYIVSMTERYDNDTQMLSVSEMESGVYRVLCFSMQKEAIAGNSGAILKATLQVSGKVNANIYEGTISNIVVTKVNGTQLKLVDTTFDIEIRSFMIGDVNGDEEINVTDIVEMVNAIMEQPTERFIAEAADVNGDGEVNVTDIVHIVSIIMEDSNGARLSETDMVALSRRTGDDLLTNNDFLALSLKDNGCASLELMNEMEYVAAQFDVRLGEGQQIKAVTLNGIRKNGHLVSYEQTSHNTWRVLVYSLDNETFLGCNGELLNISIDGSRRNVTIDNILFVTNHLSEKRFAPLHSGTTGIDAMLMDCEKENSEAYDLQGRQIDSSTQKAGLLIINSKKILK